MTFPSKEVAQRSVLSVVAMGERRAVKQREEEHLKADQEILHGGAHLVRAVGDRLCQDARLDQRGDGHDCHHVKKTA